MLALAVSHLPDGDQWEYELKLDGYRAVAVKHSSAVTVYSRNRKNFSHRYPGLVQALSELPEETILDGEIVALDESGKPSFHRLQDASVDTPLTFFAFDLLMLEGRDMLGHRLEERRELLRGLVSSLPEAIRFSESFNVSAERMIAAVREQGLEGVVAKRRDSLYQPGKRTGAWVKLRIGGRQEFVIGGYVPQGNNFDSLIVGYYEGRRLCIRPAFGLASCRNSGRRYSSGSRTYRSPRAPSPISRSRRKADGVKGLTSEDMEKCLWAKPKLVAEIAYAELTPSHHLRHPKFLALRDDK